MNPPLTSLNPIDWLVFADWSADHDRVKAERFARKCAKSLQKFLAVGADPRATLYSGTSFHPVGPEAMYTYVPAQALIRWGNSYRHGGVARSAKLCTCFWVRPQRTFSNDLRNTPADLPKEWQQTRLAFKFWKLLNRRALGIKDSVLEVADGKKD